MFAIFTGKKGVAKAPSGSDSESDKAGDSSEEEAAAPRRQNHNRNTLQWIEDNFDPVGKPKGETGVWEEKDNEGGDGGVEAAREHIGTEMAMRAATLAAGGSNPAIKVSRKKMSKLVGESPCVASAAC